MSKGQPGSYAKRLRGAATVAVKRKAAEKREAAKKEAPAPLPAWMTGDKRGLPMKPPGKEGGK